jgi:hypothetical protein
MRSDGVSVPSGSSFRNSVFRSNLFDAGFRYGRGCGGIARMPLSRCGWATTARRFKDAVMNESNRANCTIWTLVIVGAAA